MDKKRLIEDEEFGVAEIVAEAATVVMDESEVEVEAPVAPVIPWTPPFAPSSPGAGDEWTEGGDRWVWDGMHTWLGQIRPDGTRPPNR